MPIVDKSGFMNSGFARWVEEQIPSNQIQGDVGADGDNDINFVDLATEQHIVPSTKSKTLTGVWNPDTEIDGWVWDKRLLQSETVVSTRYNTFVGGHAIGLLDGTKSTDWQSGVVENIAFTSISKQSQDQERVWTPVVHTGVYSMFWDKKILFSDYSVVTKFDVNNLDSGSMYYDLPSDAVHDTIAVNIFYRDQDFRNWNFTVFGEVSTFTESLASLDSDRQVSTVSDRDYEYTISSSDRLSLNGSYYLVIGDDTLAGGFSTGSLDLAEVEQYWEHKGTGQLTGRDLYLNYYPIQDSSVVVVSVDSSGTITEWTEVDRISDLGTTGAAVTNGYVVDHDLGIVTMSGYQAPDMVLAEAIDDLVETIVVYPDLDLSGWPSEGSFSIGSEEIEFKQRDGNIFRNVTRGANSTLATSHNLGDDVEHVPQGLGTEEEFYVAYTAVSRIEYEVSDSVSRTATSSKFIDIKPGSNVKTNNLLEILPINTNVAQILLETDSPLIAGNLYGPVTYGTDTSNLTATVLDSRGNTVPGVEVVFEIQSGPGGINGPLGTFTTISNSEGIAYAIFNAPYDRDDIEFVADTVIHDGPDTRIDVGDLPSDLSLEDIWVFQIFKHDKFYGSAGLKQTILASASASEPYGQFYLDIDGIIGEEYLDASIQILRTDLVLETAVVTFLEDQVDGSGITFTRVWIDTVVSSALVNNKPCWLLESDASVWNPLALNGVRNIVYEYDATATHPIDASTGAYVPIHPDSVTAGSLLFSARNLPIPDPDDRSNNLGGYVVVAPANVSIVAKAQDPVSGRVIQSNVIRLRLQLAESLVGVDTSGVLPIPYGWNLITSSFNVGTALGGANFITINNLADSINRFTIAGLL